MNTYQLMLIPTVSNFIVNICLLGAGFFLFVVALALFSYLLDRLTRVFDFACNWLEYKLQKRKVRRRSLAHFERSLYRPNLINSPRPVPVASNTSSTKRGSVLPYKPRRAVDAREALRRSASQVENHSDFPRRA